MRGLHLCAVSAAFGAAPHGASRRTRPLSICWGHARASARLEQIEGHVLTPRALALLGPQTEAHLIWEMPTTPAVARLLRHQ